MYVLINNANYFQNSYPAGNHNLRQMRNLSLLNQILIKQSGLSKKKKHIHLSVIHVIVCNGSLIYFKMNDDILS